jgi:NAD(P)-dependent dehydrogenase (short-subunit alcohol dehydrogenase family)
MSEAVAVVTGGKGDLARAICARLSDRHYQVHSPDKKALDITEPERVRAFFSQIERIDLLINNAGAREDSTIAKMTEGAWDRVIAINLRGAFLCSQAVSMKMIAQRSGHIINIGSFSARFGNFGQTNYAAAKAGLIGLTQSLAREMGKRGVRVNCVLPGFLETKFIASVPAEIRKKILQTHELGKFNTIEEAARFIAFLDTLTFVSGQVFQLDSRLAPWT